MTAPSATGRAHFGVMDTALLSSSSPYFRARQADVQSLGDQAGFTAPVAFSGQAQVGDAQAYADAPSLFIGTSFPGQAAAPGDVQAVGDAASLAVSFIVSAIIFVEGVASDHDLSQYYSIPSGQNYSSLQVSVGTLPTGVTLDSANQRLSYNGVGSAAVSTGVILELITSATLTTFSLVEA